MKMIAALAILLVLVVAVNLIAMRQARAEQKAQLKVINGDRS